MTARQAIRKTTLFLAIVGVACFGPLASSGAIPRSVSVVATVNGVPITLQDFNAEIEATNIPAAADKSVAQRDALQHLIDRKLLLSTLPLSRRTLPSSLTGEQRRALELMLVQGEAKQQLQMIPVPTATDIDNFMSEHSNAFLNRETLQLDQIRFRPTPSEVARLNVIKSDHSLDAVGQHLTGLGIQFDRSSVSLDTGQVPTNLIKAINELPSGEPFVLPSQGTITVNVIVGRQRIAVEGDARQAAIDAWRQQRLTSIIADKLRTLRAHAKIVYKIRSLEPR